MKNIKNSIALFSLILLTTMCSSKGNEQTAHQVGYNKYSSISPGELWLDNEGNHINAHGGGMLYHNGTYYWFGEHKGEDTNSAMVGVMCYSSQDLYNWTNRGVALAVIDDDSSAIAKGSIIERPKVIYNEKTKKFVMYFHNEIKGRGYGAAHVGIAVSDKVDGPYKLISSSRVNAAKWPLNMDENQKYDAKDETIGELKWWTPEWYKELRNGRLVRKDFAQGQMSRDMTLYVDEDGKAYHIYSSEENLTLHIAELTDDYLSHTGKYIRIAPGGHNEAPAIFKKEGLYYMITSGCTGWDPNAARLFVSDNMMGNWKEYPNPCVGADAELTFHSQSTFIIGIQGKKDAYIYMGDRWRPKHPIDGRYVWLPILFEKGLPVLKWVDEWDLSIFDDLSPTTEEPKDKRGWTLIWSDEFNNTGRPNPAVWGFEEGFARNEEFQWYQSDNALCENGVLTITGRREHVINPNFVADSKDWRRNRVEAKYTSSSMRTMGKKEFKYGRFEIRAKIPTATGSWPAIWTLGVDKEWPSNGEIDIMEYYQIGGKPHILANLAWGADRRYNAAWNTKTIPFAEFLEKDPLWANKFHVWRMDWDEEAVRIYIDDNLVNETLLANTKNGSLGNYENPFHQPHYILLNLAIGGQNGGIPDDAAFPLQYQVDYVRVYSKDVK